MKGQEQAQEQKQNQNQEVAYIKLINCSLEPLGDRVLVEEDIFRSGYECEKCSGFKVITCGLCNGAGTEIQKGSEISLGAQRKCPQCFGAGETHCPTCRGTGLKAGGIVIPETSERRTTTGTIRAVGPEVRNSALSAGTKIIYPFFAGIDIKYKQKPLVRFLYEKEIVAIIHGTLMSNI